VHVVVFHSFEEPNLCKWGYSWVTFYFILSGFVLTYDQVRRGHPASAFTYSSRTAGAWLWKRFIGVYPLFVLSLILVLSQLGSLRSQPVGVWLNLIPMLTMLHAWAWAKDCTDTEFFCSHTVWNEPAWFISALFFHWLLFPIIYRIVARSTLFACACCQATCFALSFWELLVWPVITDYPDSEIETIEVISSRNPILTLYLFVTGCVLCKIFLAFQLQPSGATKLTSWSLVAVRYAATPTAAAIVLLFSFVDLNAVQCKCGVFILMYSLLIVSFAYGADPLSRLFSLGPLPWFGQFAYPVYILQAVGMSYSRNLFCTSVHCSPENGIAAVRTLFPALFAISFLAYYTVQMPVAAYYHKPPIPGCGARHSTTS